MDLLDQALIAPLFDDKNQSLLDHKELIILWLNTGESPKLVTILRGGSENGFEISELGKPVYDLSTDLP